MNKLKSLFSNNEKNRRAYLKYDAHKFLGTGMLLMLLILLASVYLSPLLYMGSMSLQPQGKPGKDPHPLIPSALRTHHTQKKQFQVAEIGRLRLPLTFEYEGEEYPVYNLELADSSLDGPYALIAQEGDRSTFVNTEDPDADPVQFSSDDLAEPQPIGDLQQATERVTNLTLNLYDVQMDGEWRRLGLFEITRDDIVRWLDPEDAEAGFIEQPVSELPKAKPILENQIAIGLYDNKVPDMFEYQGEEYEVVRFAWSGISRPTRYALLEDRGDSGTFIAVDDPNAEPFDLGPEELNNTPLSRLERAVTHYKVEAPIYAVQVDGETKQLGLIEDQGDGITLWMDPSDPSALPFELNVSVSEDQLVYAEVNAQLYDVPVPGSGKRELADLYHEKDMWLFIDPKTEEALSIKIREGKLEKLWKFEAHPENYEDALHYGQFDFFQLFRNTLLVSVVGGFGAMISATLVAYGFTRFSIPYGNLLFVILLSTIMLPPQVTQIPTYIVFEKIGWIGTLMPLIVPHFFANAYNVFLLRQYMMGIPHDLDDAARVDGANPFQILWYVIIPSARPALVAVYLFHFLFAWNDFTNPLIYVGQGRMDKQVLAVGLQGFSQIYSDDPQLMMAAGVMTMVVPLVIFFTAQRIFMQGVVITGVEK